MAELDIATYADVFRAEPLERIALARAGVSAARAKAILKDLEAPAAWLNEALNIPTSTLNRKAKAAQSLSPDESERLLGLARLVGQVQAMGEAAGSVDDGFDARAWTMRWLSEPLPALAGARPIEFLDTMEGQALVSRLLAQIEGGAYA